MGAAAALLVRVGLTHHYGNQLHALLEVVGGGWQTLAVISSTMCCILAARDSDVIAKPPGTVSHTRGGLARSENDTGSLQRFFFIQGSVATATSLRTSEVVMVTVSRCIRAEARLATSTLTEIAVTLGCFLEVAGQATSHCIFHPMRAEATTFVGWLPIRVSAGPLLRNGSISAGDVQQLADLNLMAWEPGVGWSGAMAPGSKTTIVDAGRRNLTRRVVLTLGVTSCDMCLPGVASKLLHSGLSV